MEWDAVKYPSTFKVPTLNTFDDKRSVQQHIYYFQSQTGSLMGNDPMRTRLFISTLKGVAFEWFRKLPKGSISCWDDLEALLAASSRKRQTSTCTLSSSPCRRKESWLKTS